MKQVFFKKLRSLKQYINHIFLTHSHSDHITDLPFLIDGFFENRKETLIIYGSNETINTLRKHTFNNEIWPDFSNINLINSDKKAIIFKEIKINQIENMFDVDLSAISNDGKTVKRFDFAIKNKDMV